MADEFIKFQYSVSRITLNKNGVKAKFKSKLSDLHKEAIRAFIEAAVKVIPAYTGMTLASFIPLAEAVGATVDINNVVDSNGPGKSIGDGILAGQQGIGYFISQGNDGKFEFIFSPAVFHYRINEFVNANRYINPETGLPYFKLKQPGPYHSIERGKAAYMAFIKKEIPKRLKIVKEIFGKPAGLIDITNA